MMEAPAIVIVGGEWTIAFAGESFSIRLRDL